MLATALLTTFLGLCAQDERSRVLDILAAAARAPAPAVEQLVRELSRPGPAVLSGILDVLGSGEVAGRALSSDEEAALQRTLASFGAPPLRALVERRLASALVPEQGCALIVALGRVGDGQDLGLVRRVAEATGPAASRSGALEGAVADLVRRDARGLEPVRRWVLQAPGELGDALVNGTGKSENPAALPVLAGLLGERAELDAQLLPALGSLASRAEKPIDEAVLAPVEALLESDDPRLLRAAALALGEAEAAGVLPRLIELLEDHDRGVSSAAERALEQLTGLRLRDGARWRAWHLAESRWFEAEGPRVLGELASPSPEIAVRALGELSCHRMHRQELALAAAPALAHRSPLVRRLACTALAHLGSRAAGPALLAALEDEDERVVQAARQALEALGLAPPRDPDVPVSPVHPSPAGTGQEHVLKPDEPRGRPAARARVVAAPPSITADTRRRCA